MLSEKEILHAFSSDQDMMTILQIIYDLQLKDSWLSFCWFGDKFHLEYTVGQARL